MTSFRISPDDPKLTAYALGELPEDQRLAIEAALVDNPDARAAVAQTRALAAQLCDALAHEPDAGLTGAPVARERTSKLALNGVHVLPPNQKSPANLLRFPQLYYVIGGVAAAGFAVMLALREPKPQAVAPIEAKAAIATSSPAPNAPITPPAAAAVPDQSEPIAIQPIDHPSSGATNVAVTESLPLPKVESAPASDTATTAIASTNEAPVVAPAPVNPPTNLGLLDNLKHEVTPVVVFPQTYAFPGVQPRLPDPVLVRRVDIGPTWAVNSRTTDETPAPKRSSAAKVQKVRVTASNDRTPAQSSNGVYYYPPDEKFVMRAEPIPQPGAHETVPRKSKPNIFWWGQNGSSVDKGSPFNFRDRSIAIAPFGQYDLLARATSTDPVRASEQYAYRPENAFVAAAQVPFSTFSIDVDTASYADVRRFIEAGQLPPQDAVRMEELLNYFPYRPTTSSDAAASPAATPAAAPFTTSLEVAAAPWAPTHRLVRIGLKARETPLAARGPANLVFLLDVSGSMSAPNKLPLVKQSMRLLLDRLRPDDHVAIVTYAGSSGLALASTAAAKSREILDALESLTSAGSTHGAMGMQLAYDIAKANFVPNGINRVILCTDGDFNVGLTNEGELARLVEEKAKTGVTLTVLGFGKGNFQDGTLQLLAQKGNGNYGYIDSRREAEKLLVEQVNGTLVTVAKDVKVQVDFNPARVASYRLIGYESRLLQTQDFNNDAVDAGDVGAGHAVTALYEIVPVGVADDPAAVAPPIDRSRYAYADPVKTEGSDARSNELLAVKIRYKDPAATVSKKLEFPLIDAGASFDDASGDFKFAAAVAQFGMLLRDSAYRGQATISDVIAWAAAATAQATEDPSGYRAAFLDLARRAQTLMQAAPQAAGK